MDAENAYKLVEHLRFVHFSLVSVVTGLLITATVDPGGSAAIAFRDLAAISKHLASVDDSWFEAYVENQIKLGEPEFESVKRLDVNINTFANGESLEITLPVSYTHYFFSQPFVVPGYDVDASQFESIIPMRGSVGEITAFSSTVHRLPDQAYQIETLTDIKILWNLLLVTDNAHKILRVADEILVVTDSEDSLMTDPVNDEFVDTWLSSMKSADYELPNVEHVPLDDPHGDKWSKYVAAVAHGPLDELRQNFSVINDENVLALDFLSKEIISNYDVIRWLRFPCSADNENICVVVGIPIASWFEPINGLNHLISLLNTEERNNWRDSPFATNFPELDQITRNISDLPVENLLKHLREEVQRAGEQFGAFGLSVPSSAIATWGPIIVVVVQFYFLFHLHRFRSVISSSTKVLSFPWFVLYPGVITGIFAPLTICAYPISIVLHVYLKTMISEPISVMSVVNIGVLVISGAIAYQSFRDLLVIRNHITSSQLTTG